MDVPCIRCGEVGGVYVDVGTSTEIHCKDCDETYLVGDVKMAIASWASVLNWIHTHPDRKSNPDAAG